MTVLVVRMLNPFLPRQPEAKMIGRSATLFDRCRPHESSLTTTFAVGDPNPMIGSFVDRRQYVPGRSVTRQLLGDPPPGRSAQDALDGTAYSPSDADITARYDRGETVSEICRATSLTPQAIQGVLRRLRTTDKTTKYEPRARR